MQVLYSGDLSRRKERELRAKLRQTIGEVLPQMKISFLRQPETFGQISVTLDLAEGETAPNHMLMLVCPIVDKLATMNNEAKCVIKNCGKTPVSTWHRWSNRKDSMFWK